MPTPFELHLQFGQASEQVFGIRISTGEQHWTEIGFDQPNRERPQSTKILCSGPDAPPLLIA
jgi:hypothetical protein